MTHGIRRKPLYFGGNLDHVTLGLDRVGLRLGGGSRHIPHQWVCFIWRLFHCSNFVGSGALVHGGMRSTEYRVPF